MSRFVFFSLALTIFVASHAHAEIVDRIVATVANEPILRSDLVEEVAPLVRNLRSEGVSPAEIQREVDEAMRDALDLAIERKLLYRQALIEDIQVEDEDIEERVARIKAQYDSEKEFMEALEEAGESLSDFRQQLRQQIMAISMGLRQRRLFERDAVVSESEIAQYYEDAREEFSQPERIQLRRIFLRADEDQAERRKVRARLETLREEAELGADFGELAKTYSEGPSKEAGGMVGWVTRGALVPELEEAAFELEEGEVSPVIEMDRGFALLKADRREDAGIADLDDARVQIEPILREQHAEERYRKWIEELRKRGSVRVLL